MNEEGAQGVRVAVVDRARKTEILDTAATLFAARGLRTSLQEIADACGILPGSLYHHFDSKEAIIIEMIERYQAELDHISERAVDALDQPDGRSESERIVALATAIAACGIRHRAALLLTFYEPPVGASDDLVRLVRRTPAAIERAMLETLRTARSNGYLRPNIELHVLADRICQSMLHIGIGVTHQAPGAEQVPALRCSILLNGVAVRPPVDTTLNRSEARRAADEVIETWDDANDSALDDKAALIRAVARAEFARRGYEATTIRDIASAAGLSTGAVYRLIRSKDELLSSIMRAPYSATVAQGWDSVLTSNATPIEKLDALLWFNVKVLDRFSEEFKIHTAWMRGHPPKSPNLGSTFSAQLRKLKTLLAEGLRGRDLEIEKSSADMRARSVFALIWMPENIVRGEGTRGALALARDTVLRGVAQRA